MRDGSHRGILGRIANATRETEAADKRRRNRIVGGRDPCALGRYLGRSASPCGYLQGLFFDGLRFRTIPTLLGAVLVLGFDLAWVIFVVKKSWLIRNRRARVYLTVFVLMVSAALLTAVRMMVALSCAFV